ncbi:MAG TPA: hypothetical protein VHY79_15840 [Rhizomicrobium sp.]|nr:hypothetical protein [Rhizomicrobium sp.]
MRGLGCETAGKNREPPKYRALGVRQEIVAPVERRVERLLARRCRSSSRPEQCKPAFQQRSSITNAAGGCTSRGKLDCERNSAELAAHVSDDPRVLVAQHVAETRTRKAIEEQLDRRIGKRFRRGQRHVFRRADQRRQRVHVLAFGPQSFTACRKNMKIRHPSEQTFRDHGCLGDQVLAAVQDEQYTLTAEMLDEFGNGILSLNRQTEGRHDFYGQKLRRADRTEFDEAYRAKKFPEERMCGGKRGRRLPYASRSNDGQELS